MEAHLIDTRLVVPRSRSSVKVKDECQGHVWGKTKKKGHHRGTCVSQTHLVFKSSPIFECYMGPMTFQTKIN